MADNWMDTTSSSDLTVNFRNRINKSGTDKWINGTECVGVQYIPGIVSIDTVRGFTDFYIKYSRIHGHIAVAVCLFGILSNSANIIVLTRKSMASSTNTLLLWLAVADLLTMLDYLPFAIHFYIMKPSEVEAHAFSTSEFSWICFLLFHASFSIVCHTVAIWLTIALAIFRYIYICKPTRGTHYCNQHRACFVVVVIIILTIILCIPNYFVNTYDFTSSSGVPYSVNNNTGNISKTGGVTYYFPAFKKDTEANRLTFLVNSWVQAMFFKLVPCFMLVTLTLLLVHAMHKAYRKRLKLKSQGRRAESDKHGEHNRTTGMLLAVVVLFTLTELPQGILTLMNIFVKCFTDVVYNKLGDLLDIMALTNNSVNFVLYCTMSKQFRTTFAAIFCPQRSSRPKWLKMAFIKTQQGNKNVIEVVDDGKSNIQVNCNGPLLNNAEVNRRSPESAVNYHTCQVVQHRNLCDNSENAGSLIRNDKNSLSIVSANGITTHTHGYSAAQSHL